MFITAVCVLVLEIFSEYLGKSTGVPIQSPGFTKSKLCRILYTVLGGLIPQGILVASPR